VSSLLRINLTQSPGQGPGLPAGQGQAGEHVLHSPRQVSQKENHSGSFRLGSILPDVPENGCRIGYRVGTYSSVSDSDSIRSVDPDPYLG
jgi:hypothetical protein